MLQSSCPVLWDHKNQAQAQHECNGFSESGDFPSLDLNGIGTPPDGTSAHLEVFLVSQLMLQEQVADVP